MKVLVLGATGRTGKAVVERALAGGHEVTAFVRDASKINIDSARVVQGEATSRSDVDAAMNGQQAVIDTIGGKAPYKQTDLESSAASTIIASMQANGVRRLLAISMLGVGESRKNTPIYEFCFSEHFFAAQIRTNLRWKQQSGPAIWTGRSCGLPF